MSQGTKKSQEFTWKGRTGPFSVALTPEVFKPSLTSVALAEAMEVRPGEVVLDVGCGSGVLSFVAARLDASMVYGCDLSEEAVTVASANASRLGLEERTEFRAGNLLDPVRDVRADVVIGDVSGIPDSVAELTGWFPGGRGGGPTGAELPVAMLEDLGECLKPGGRLYLPTGTIQAQTAVLDVAHEVFGKDGMELVSERDFPLPGSILESSRVAKLVSDGLLNLTRKGSRLLWRLAIWRCIRR